MIILTSTDKIQVLLGSSVTTNQLECFASYRDTTSSTITPGSTYSLTNNTTPVDLIGSPAASTQRVVDYISVYNADVGTEDVTIRYDVSGTSYILIKATLLPNEKLEYQEGIGFKSLAIDGALKQGSEMGYNTLSGYSITNLSADVVNANAVQNTIADVTGLSFAVTSGKTYWFRFTMVYTSVSAATGARFSINGPATSALYYESQYTLTTSSITVNCGLSTYNQPAASNATSNFGTAPAAGNIATIEGIAVFSASGTLIARFASEVANSAITVRAGSTVQYKQLD